MLYIHNTTCLICNHLFADVIIFIDSQGSADTSRSQHTDITSELSSVVSVPDKTGMCNYTCVSVDTVNDMNTVNVGSCFIG